VICPEETVNQPPTTRREKTPLEDILPETDRLGRLEILLHHITRTAIFANTWMTGGET
jgi:hypothetical protein